MVFENFKDSDGVDKGRNWLVRSFLIVSGSLAVVLGIAGIFLPILPTTPFLLLAAYCYVRSSKRLFIWLVSNRWTGESIRNYSEGKGIPWRAKVFMILLLWGTLTLSATLLTETAIRLFLALVGLTIPILILKVPTREP